MVVTVFGFPVTRTVTVTTNGCAYKVNATKNTNSAGGIHTPFSADLSIECPKVGEVTKEIEVHVYSNGAEPHSGSVTCTYDIPEQTVNNQIQLTNEPGNPDDIVAHVTATLDITNTMPGGVCTNAITSEYHGKETLTATNAEDESVNSTVS